MKGFYTVCFASDGRGVLPLSVAVWSLLRCAKEDTTYDIRLLGDNIPSSEVEKIEKLVKKAGKRHRISYVEIQDLLSKDLDIKGRMPRATWARIFVPHMLPDVNRALYLDIDVQICRDLTDLMETDLGNCVMAGVLEEVPVHGKEFFPELGLPHTCAGYFNAGVLLMDLATMRSENLVEKILLFVKQHSKKPLNALDQDAINGALYDRILPIHPRWNWCDGNTRRVLVMKPGVEKTRGYTLLQMAEAACNPAILHFWGQHKPWRYNYRMEGKRYEKCMREAGLLTGRSLPGFSAKAFFKKMTHAPLYALVRMRLRCLCSRYGIKDEG